MIRTYQPKERQCSKKYESRERMRTADGRKILARRRTEGRAHLIHQWVRE